MSEYVPAKRYFSIKWQAFSLTSLVLALIFASFLYFVSESTFRQFEIGRGHIYEQNKQQLDSLIESSGEKLIQLATTSVLSESFISKLMQGNQAALQERLDELSWYLQVESGVEHLALFDSGLKLLSMTGVGSNYELLETLKQTESPEWSVRCDRECMIHGGTPILAEGEVVGYVLLSEPLSNVMLRFQHISNIDTGLLANSDPVSDQPITQSSSIANYSEHIPQWEKNLVALTNPKYNKQIINSASSLYSLDDLKSGIRLVDIEGEVFELRALPIKDNQVVVISNVSQDVTSMEKSRSDSVRISVISLVAAELILLLLLWRPMTRIKKTASILPLLAEKKYSDAKQSFTDLNKKILFRDETDILNVTALKLSAELEELQGQLETRAEQLELRGEELERERDFVSQLLDTVHAIILIQDEHGNIQLSNKFAVRLSGFSGSELQGRTFVSLMDQSEETNSVANCIVDVVQGRLSEFQHESSLNTRFGDKLHLAWRHSVLYNHESEERQVLSVAVDISARVKAEEELAWLANHDTLSGLLNRRRFEEELEKTISDFRRYKSPFALVYIDLDDFKSVNDNYGHTVGDQLIQSVAQILKTNARQTDVSARIGGDEFGLLLRSVKPELLEVAVSRVVNEIASISIENGEAEILGSASLGVALVDFSNNDMGDVEIGMQELIKAADMAMYQAKREGKNNWYICRLD